MTPEPAVPPLPDRRVREDRHRAPRRVRTPLALVTVALVALLVASGVRPFDRATWVLEVLPVVVVLPILWATRVSFPLTTLLYACILVHGAVLIVGGHYTYARVPAGFAFAEMLGLDRNPYDKLGHLLQGFVPALVAREILVRGRYVRGPRMLAFLVLCVVMAISAGYEIVEWLVAEAIGQGADEFLGTQGYAWDTQSDMLCALVGGSVALLGFSRLHDRAIARLETAVGGAA